MREDKLMILEDDREGATVEFCFLPWQIVAGILDFFSFWPVLKKSKEKRVCLPQLSLLRYNWRQSCCRNRSHKLE